MTSATAFTLYDEWQERRNRLLSRPAAIPQHRELQLQILDFLLSRYRDSAAARRPAAAPVQGGGSAYHNQRLIVVHHHLGQGRVGGVANHQEAEARVASIVRRMAAGPPGDATESAATEMHNAVATDDDRATNVSDEVKTFWREISLAIQVGDKPHRCIDAALRTCPMLPRLAVSYLCMRITDVKVTDVEAARLLVRCANPTAAREAVSAWQKRLSQGRSDGVTRTLEEAFCKFDVHARAADALRTALAHPNSFARLRAAKVLGRIGNLEDISLLSDLLALPRNDDEDPRERPALLWAMRRLAQDRQ